MGQFAGFAQSGHPNKSLESSIGGFLEPERRLDPRDPREIPDLN
jgi:hypothetical protein